MLSNIRLYTILTLLTAYIGARAEETVSFSQKMNEIKRSGEYVYALSSAPNEDDAKAACDALLKIEITKYLVATDPASQTDGRIIKDITDYRKEYLVQPRGDMTRIFGYVSKKDISAAGSVTAPAPAPQVKKEPDNGSTMGTTTARKAYVRTEAPAPAPEPAAQNAIKLNTEGLELAKWQTDMLENIVNEPGQTEAKKLLNRYKNQNRIKRLGNNTNPNPRPTDTFYLIYDGSGNPAAFLAPSLTREHRDLLSGATVSLDSYSGNQFLWFQISQ